MSDSVTMPSADVAENGAWACIDGQWQHLFGSFFGEGLSIEWHDFVAAGEFDWGRSFHRESLELCLNFSGSAKIGAVKFEANEVGLYSRQRRDVSASREAGERHQFITVEMSRDFLARNLGAMLAHLSDGVRDFIRAKQKRGGDAVLATRPMNAVQQTLGVTLRQPPVSRAAQPIWYQGKVLELLSEFLFPASGAGQEFFCARQKRLSRERIERVCAILREHLETPPDLAQIAREVGCSPFYLSRLFSEETGMTIPRYLRKLRMEKAAELLLSGKFNVTEAALEVGYSSLSHFSRAFCEATGYCPALYATMMAARSRPGRAA